MMLRRTALLLLLPLTAGAADWNAAAAARYLDSRAAAWAAWPHAQKEGGPCVSCHTTLAYLLARPMLRHTLGESQPTEFETGLLAGVKVRALKPAPEPSADNTPTVLNALVLAQDDARRGGPLRPETEAAFRALWATERGDGAWRWTNANLEPWEVPESEYFGVALAAAATGIAPAGYQSRPEIAANIARMKDYLREHGKGQPLANRLVLLWAASRLNDLTGAEQRAAILHDAHATQNPDGGWTLTALGPWRDRPNAPPAASGSNAFATAWAAAMLRLAGADPGARALAWLRAHQDPAGFWDAVSMNKPYPAGSMQERFMRDAATGWAALALAPTR